MSNIMEQVSEYNMLRAKSKTIKSRMDELAKNIKAHLTKNVTPDSKGSYYAEDENFVYGNMAKKSIKLNEESSKFIAETLKNEALERAKGITTNH